MNNLARILRFACLVALTVFFVSCDKGDDSKPDETAAQIEKLVGTWAASSVSYEGDTDPHTEDYADFTLTISAGANNTLLFTANDRPVGLSPWPASGTFTFGNPVVSKLLRDDDVTIGYTVSGNTLQMTITDYSGEGYAVAGRVETVAGDWVFNLTKQQ